jgi:hypothetical protein
MAKLSVVAEVAAGVPDDQTKISLSPARQELIRAQQLRTAAQAAFAEATRQHRRVEALTDGGKPAIEARIVQLERAHTEIFEKWALTEGGEPPAMPHAAEIAALKNKLPHAETVAAGAKAALARMNDELRACQEDSARAIERIRDAADGVLVEIAGELAAELETLEKRAALVRGYLLALQRHFELEGHRGRPVNNLQSVVGRMIPRGPLEMAQPGINAAVQNLSALANGLINDPSAQLTELKS